MGNILPIEDPINTTVQSTANRAGVTNTTRPPARNPPIVTQLLNSLIPPNPPPII